MIRGGLLCILFPYSLLHLGLTGVDPKNQKTLLWGEAVIGLSGFRQKLMEGLWEQSVHCHDEPNTEKIWVKPSCILSLGKSEETVTESRAVVVLNMSISGVLFCFWALFNTVNSCHPGISLLGPLLSFEGAPVFCFMSSCV